MGKPKARHKSFKLKNRKGLPKVPKPMTARKNLSYAAHTTAKVGGTMQPNLNKTNPIPAITQSPIKPLFAPEIIEINSDDSEDETEGKDPNPDPDPNIDQDGNGRAAITKNQMVIKMEHPDYMEGLTEADFEFDPDSSLGGVPGVAAAGAASITASIPAPIVHNTTPGTTTVLNTQLNKVSAAEVATLTLTHAVILSPNQNQVLFFQP